MTQPSSPEFAPNRAPANGAPAPPPPPGYPETASDELTLGSVVGMILQEWKTVVGVFLLIVALAVALAFIMEPQYRASTVVLVEPQSQRFSSNSLENVLAAQSYNRTLFNEVVILQESVPLAEQVAARLFEAEEEFPITQPEDEEEDAPTIGRVARRMLNDEAVLFEPFNEFVDLIKITGVSSDPEEAAAIANLYAEEYYDRTQDISRSSIVSSREFIEEQLAVQNAALEDAEGALEDYMASAGAIALPAESQNAVTQVGSLDGEIGAAQVSLQVEEAALRQLREQVEEVRPGLTQRLASNVDAEMAALKSRIAELELQLDTYYAANPGLRGNEASVPEAADLLAQINQRRARLAELSEQYYDEVMAVGGLDSGSDASGVGNLTRLLREINDKEINVQGLRAKLGTLRSQRGRLNARLREIPQQSIRLAQLQREQQARLSTVLLLREKLQEAQVAEEAELGYIQLIRQADVPVKPVSPNLLLNLAIGCLLGLILGLGVALIRRAADRRIHTPEDLRSRGFSVLGGIPPMKDLIKRNFGGAETVEVSGRDVRTTVAAALHPLSPVAEAFRHVRTSIRFSVPDRRLQVLAVTSAGPGEGKTTTAMNLAVSMAQAGFRTLYVDADLRKPAGHGMLGLSRRRGLSDLLFQQGAADWESFRVPLHVEWEDFDDYIDNLYAVTAGKSVPSPADLLGSKRFKELVDEMRGQFDIVVVDTPPVLPVTDPVLIAPVADAVLLVASADQTDWRGLERTRELIAMTGTSIIGVVLNRFEPQRHTSYGYGSYGYGYGYGASDNFRLSGDGSTARPEVAVPNP